MKNRKILAATACGVVALAMVHGWTTLRAQSPTLAVTAPPSLISTLSSDYDVLVDSHRVLHISGRDGMAYLKSQEREGVIRTMPLPERRLGSSAVTLPDGRILIWGGVNSRGNILQNGVWFDPQSSTFSEAVSRSLPATAGQSMTLLTDGTILIAGGWSPGAADHPAAWLWNAYTDAAQPIAVKSGSLPITAVAQLLSDGSVAIRDSGNVSQDRERELIYSPESRSLSIEVRDPAFRTDPPAFSLAGSYPASGATEVPPSQVIALRFSAEADPATAGAKSVALIGPAGPVSAKITIAEGGRLAFIVPTSDLLTGTDYSVLINGIKRRDGVPLPVTSFEFETSSITDAATKGAPSSSIGAAAQQATQSLLDPGAKASATTYVTTGVDSEGRLRGARAGCTGAAFPLKLCREKGYIDDGAWYPGQNNAGEGVNGRWRLNTAESIKPQEIVEALRASHARRHDRSSKGIEKTLEKNSASGTGDISGVVSLIDGRPIAGVMVSVGAISSRTDSNGSFVLRGLKPGHDSLFVDGSTASNQNREYGQFAVGVNIEGGVEAKLPFRLYMPRILGRDKIRMASPTLVDMVVTHPDIPGLEIHIPKGTVIKKHDGKVATEFSIVPMPVDRAPFPAAANFPVFFSLQPGGATVQNVDPQGEPGISITYPNYAGAKKGSEANFFVYRPEDGWRIYGKGNVTADGRQIKPQAGIRLTWLMAGSFGLSKQHPGDDNPTKDCGPCDGDPVDLWSGTFFETENDIAIKDIIPIELSRVWHANAYHALDPRMFGGWRSNYDIYVYSPNADFTAPRIRLPNGNTLAFTQIATRQGDTYTWEYKGDPSPWYGAVLETVSFNSRCGAIIECFLLTKTDGTEYQFTNSYPSNGAPSQLTFIRDRFGNQLSFTWNAGLLQQVTSPSGRFVKLTYDEYNNIEAAEDNSGRRWAYAYHRKQVGGTGINAGARTTAATQAAASDPLEYAYFLDRVTFPDGTFKQYTYQDDYTPPAAGSLENDLPGTLLTITDRNGKTTVSNTYEQNSVRVSKQVLADGGTYQFVYTKVDGIPTRTQVTDPLGHIRSVDFDRSTGYPSSETLAFGTPIAQTTTFVRSGAGQVTSMVDPLGRKTTFQYDSNGNVTAVRRLAGTPEEVVRTSIWSDNDSLLLSRTDELGKTTKMSYTDGCLSTITDPMGHTTFVSCNAQGQPTEIKDPLGHVTQFAYEGTDLAKITDGVGRSVSFIADPLGRIIATTDAAGTVLKSYDTNDSITSVTSPNGDYTTFSYDNERHVVGIRRPNGATIRYEYNARYLRTLKADSLDSSEIWSYDQLGNIQAYTDRSGKTTQFAPRDDLNRFTSLTDADGASIVAEQYDAGNRLLRVSDTSSGEISRLYDDLDNLVDETSDGRTTAYSWFPNGKKKTMKADGQPLVTYHYDDANRLTEIIQGVEHVGISYDAAGRRSLLKLPNGITASYGYNQSNQVTSIRYTSAGGALVAGGTYQYDDAGQRVMSSGTWADTQPSPVSQTNSYDINNRLLSASDTSIQYDDDGNVVDDGRRTYRWNARGQLVEVREGGVVTATFTYDALGRRKSKAVGASVTTFDYDGQSIIGERKDGLLTPILTGLGLDERFVRGSGATREYFLTDALGSTIALADASSSVIQKYSYDAYGKVSTDGSDSNPYEYVGRERDETDLIFVRARYYSPGLQRFMSEDPLGEAGGANLYAYVAGNPVSYLDPQGRELVLGAIGGGIGAIWGGINGYISGDRGYCLAVDIAAGAGAGALAGLTNGGSLLGTIAARSLISAGIDATRQMINGAMTGNTDISWSDVGFAAAGSLVGDGAGEAAWSLGSKAATAFGGMFGGAFGFPPATVSGAQRANQ